MDENSYLRIKDQFLKSCRTDIVRVFDDAFLERWKKYMGEKRRGLMAEAFVPPAIACLVLWYVFSEMSRHRLLHFSTAVIMICAFLHYAFTIRHHKEWVLDRFTDDCIKEVAEKCLLECKETMTEQARTVKDAEKVSAFFCMAMQDSDIVISMYRVWLNNSRKMR